jgi:hypothetical protein
MSAEIIQIGTSRAKLTDGPVVDRDGSLFVEMCRPMHFLEGMPFVDPKPPADSRSAWNCWNDGPTDSGRDDFQRGERYGRMVVDAITARTEAYNGHKLALSISAIDLEKILESMIRDGVARALKGGNHSRAPVTSAMSGFLFALTRFIAGIRDGT